MKLAVAIIAACSLTPVWAQEPDAFSGKATEQKALDATPEAPVNLLIQHESITLPTTLASQLIRQFPNQHQLRLELQKLCDANKATIIHTSILRCRSGERICAESVYRYIYPTEYYPLGETYGPDKRKRSPYNSFEETPFGVIVEADLTHSSDLQYISLTQSFETRELAPPTKANTVKDEMGYSRWEDIASYRLKVQTGVTLSAGSYHLIHVSPAPAPHKHATSQLTFVKANVLQVK